MTGSPPIFTIGHSDHSIESFVSLLQQHQIDAIADVRSHPYSRYHNQFDRECLEKSLRSAGVRYVFLGRELGARRVERECYEGAAVRYDRVARLAAFRDGLERVRRGSQSHRVALLCAEKDPITCHRAILVCRHLRAVFCNIMHVLHDGSLESTAQMESRLMQVTGVPSEHLFMTREALIEEAYEKQGERIAYRATADGDAEDRETT